MFLRLPGCAGQKPHPIDRVLHDGDEVKLGGTTLVAHLDSGPHAGLHQWTPRVRKTANLIPS